jgi:hypothetical protein
MPSERTSTLQTEPVSQPDKLANLFGDASDAHVKFNATNIRHAPNIYGKGNRSRRGQSACKCHASQLLWRENARL